MNIFNGLKALMPLFSSVIGYLGARLIFTNIEKFCGEKAAVFTAMSIIGLFIISMFYLGAKR